MKKVTVIGHLDWNGNDMIGAVVKARNIYEELKKQINEVQVGNVDIYEWRKRKIQVFTEIIKAFSLYKNIVLVCSDTSMILMKFFSLMKSVFKNRIHYCVVGGDIAELLHAHPEQIKTLRCIDEFYVETADCVTGLKTMGISSVRLLRNFKRIEPLDESQLKYIFTEPYCFCTFSRVIEQKGITDAILAIDRVNKEKGRKICALDIYGPIDESYKEKFFQLLKENDVVKYRGVVDANESVDVLKNYYCLLFPTKYQTEGIPGTIIDGFAAGTPVICADWIKCRQIVTDGENGIVYPFNDFDGLVNKINYAIEHTEIICGLKKKCIESYSIYMPENAIMPLLQQIE